MSIRVNAAVFDGGQRQHSPLIYHPSYRRHVGVAGFEPACLQGRCSALSSRTTLRFVVNVLVQLDILYFIMLTCQDVALELFNTCQALIIARNFWKIEILN